ncbi:MAG TPA: hypothetical protein VF058_08265 [Actinomycetota bacterium]
MSGNARMQRIGLVMLGLLLGAIMVAPAFAHHSPQHTRKQLRALDREVQQFNVRATLGQTKVLLKVGKVTVRGECHDEAGTTETLVVVSGPNGTVVTGDDTSHVIGPATTKDNRTIENPGASATSGVEVSDGYDDQFTTRHRRSVVTGTASSVANDDAGTCLFFGSYIQS